MPTLRPDVVLSGRYRLVESIGTGANGAVWRAHDEVLDRAVAVKLLHEELELEDAVRERFRREAMSAASIHHPHAAVVYDIGEDDGRPYLVMELVEGPTLSDLMDGRPVDPDVVATIGHQVAGALGAAHERGLAHRDVKPGNVLLTRDGAAKVVDFGIAKALGDATQQLTAVGTVVGTAAYLAPEQLEPHGEVDGRADVYALGLVLHELATGRSPFAGTTAAEVAAQRLVADVPSPSERHAAVPDEIDLIVAKATRRDPAARFEDGSELAAALAPLVPDRALDIVAAFAEQAPRAVERTQALPLDDTDPSRTQLIDRGRTGGDETMLIPGRSPAAGAGPDETVAIPDTRGTDATPRADEISVLLPTGRGADLPHRDAEADGDTGADGDNGADDAAPARRGRFALWAGAGVVVLAVALATSLSGGQPSGGDAGDGPGAGSPDGPHRIVAGSDFDPHGGDGEHPEDVGLAFDGDPATAWRTQRYTTAAFGGLKPGVGIVFDLGEPVEVSQVQLLLGTPGIDLRVHASDQPFEGTDLGEPVGSVDDAPAEPTIDVGGAAGRYWLVWLTSVPGGRGEIVEAEFDR